MMRRLGFALGLLLLATAAWAQPPYTVGTVLDIGYYQEVSPLSGFGFERFNTAVGVANRQVRCGIGFGGTVEVIYIMQPNIDNYVVQYTPTANPQGVLNECKGSLAYFVIQENDLTNQDGVHAAVVANPPVP